MIQLFNGDCLSEMQMGSGSVGVSAINSGRSFIGMEKDENYSKIAEERIMKSQTAYTEG